MGRAAERSHRPAVLYRAINSLRAVYGRSSWGAGGELALPKSYSEALPQSDRQMPSNVTTLNIFFSVINISALKLW